MAAGVEMQDHLGVRGGHEDGARGLQLVAQLGGVREVAVVGHRDGPAVALDEVRLGVRGHGVARGRVAGVADGPVALDGVEALLVEHVVHEAHALVGAQPLAVAGHDARRLLAAVLLRVEAEVGEVRRLGMAEDPEQRAAVVKPIVVDGGEPQATRARLVARRHGSPDGS